jgi:ABC-2 type transport system ATP-binding protein
MTITAPAIQASASTPYAVQTVGLRKTYRTRRGRQVAVAGLDLKVPAGGVHGFLGPNGSGKTTTIRMLMGLIHADSGEMRIFDHPIPQQLPTLIHRIGAIVEQPRFFPPFSGRKNLDLLARGIGAPQSRVSEVLEEVALADRAKDKFRTYSLGMKQRLAIAATLLKDPDLLIFDEPTNGLDPAGIHEIRAAMRALGQQGKTVLVSSHILAEVQQVADTVSIIGRGRLLAEGSVEKIIASSDQLSVRVGVPDPHRATEILTRAGLAAAPGADGQLSVSCVDFRPLDPALITRLLAEEGLYVAELSPVRADLESVFLQLTADDHLGTTQKSDATGPGHRTRAGSGRTTT